MQSPTARIGITQPLCETCSTPLPPGTTTCPSCGRMLASSAIPSSTALDEPLPSTQPCPHCGHPLLPGARGCPACGRSHAIVPRKSLPQPGILLEQRYRVVRALSGGMSDLLLASDEQEQGKQVVLKFALDTIQERSLKREEKILGEILHPCMPRSLGKFFVRGQEVLVLEYLDGYDLDQSLTRVDRSTGALIHGQAYPLTTVLHWGAQLCQLLDLLEQYSSGAIIHHDIKPANIICLRPENTLVLIDWGAARHSFSQPLGPGKVGLHASGTYGTVGYAPPEQYRGESTIRSDVYALAATLYHLATNDDPSEHPFHFPKLTELGAFGWLLGQALSRNPAERPSAAQFGSKLMALLRLQGETLHAPDGPALHSPQALTDWCCTHWEATRSWLSRGLPEALQLWWPTHQHNADQLHTLSQRRPISDADIDQALALIDERYNQAEPILALKAAEIDFGSCSHAHPVSRSAELRNSGRRLAHFTIEPKPASWLEITPNTYTLRPGDSVTVKLTAHPERLLGIGQRQVNVPIMGAQQELGSLPCMIQPGIGSLMAAFRRMAFSWPGLGLGLLVLSILGIFSLMSPAAPPYPVYPPTYPPFIATPAIPAVPPRFYPTPAIQEYPAPQDTPRFHSAIPFSDWRAISYVAEEYGHGLTPEQQVQAYEDAQQFLMRGEYSMAAQAFRAAGNYQYALNSYHNIMAPLRNDAYPQPSALADALELENYRRRVIVFKSSEAEPLPIPVSWSQAIASTDRQQISLSDSKIWALFNRQNPGLLSWPIEGSKEPSQHRVAFPKVIQSLIFQTTTKQTAIAFSDGASLQIINAENGDLLKSWNGIADSFDLLDVSADMRYALIVSPNGGAGQVFKVHLGSETVQDLGAMQPAARLMISPNGDIVVMIQSSGDLTIWAGYKQVMVPGAGDPVLDVAIAPRSARVAYSRRDGALRLLDLNTERLAWVAELPQGANGAIAFSHNEEKLAVAGLKRVWILAPWNGILVEHSEATGIPITQLALADDGRSMVGQDMNNSVMVWQLGK